MLTVKFITGEIVTGTAWNSLPINKIQSLKYKIKEKVIHLCGFESYNHLVEKICQVGSVPQITKTFLIGRFEDRSRVIEIDYRLGILKDYYTEVGKEYENGRATTGWRTGVKEEEPIVTISDTFY